MGQENTVQNTDANTAQKKEVSSMSYSGYEKHGQKTSIAI